jgi:hypothetical protein
MTSAPPPTVHPVRTDANDCACGAMHRHSCRLAQPSARPLSQFLQHASQEAVRHSPPILLQKLLPRSWWRAGLVFTLRVARLALARRPMDHHGPRQRGGDFCRAGPEHESIRIQQLHAPVGRLCRIQLAVRAAMGRGSRRRCRRGLTDNLAGRYSGYVRHRRHCRRATGGKPTMADISLAASRSSCTAEHSMCPLQYSSCGGGRSCSRVAGGQHDWARGSAFARPFNCRS